MILSVFKVINWIINFKADPDSRYVTTPTSDSTLDKFSTPDSTSETPDSDLEALKFIHLL